MKNLTEMMKQAQEMQDKMSAVQAELADAELTGQSGGGMISITMNGKGEARRLVIDAGLIETEDKEVLEDLIVAAINDARAKVEAHAQKKMSEVTAGLKLPGGLKLPF